MKLKLHATHSRKRLAMGGSPVGNARFVAPYVNRSGWREVEPALTSSAQWGPLQNQYDAWQRGVDPDDYIGFEDAARPLLLDPMPAGRLRAEFPDLWPLRIRAIQERQTWRLGVAPTTIKRHEEMRASLDDADHARLLRWLGRLDAATPRFQVITGSTVRQAHLANKWAPAVVVARQTGIFRNVPPQLFTLNTWPWQNSFVLRGALFNEFTASCFATLTRLREQGQCLEAACWPYLAERLLGIYLQYLALANPLLRIAEISMLHVLPDTPPGLDPAFDRQGYLRLNPDVAAAGLPPEQHYLRYGWREDRDWSWQ